MATTLVLNPASNHTFRLVTDLIGNGWTLLTAPEGGMLKSNRQFMEFRTPTRNLKIRPCIFAVGDRGESHRRDERRIQITTTYSSGLQRIAEFKDVVLGYDSQNRVYVGLDPRRLEFGGEHHNASSSVDAAALETPGKSILIRPHDTQLLGLEYQAIFKPSRLSEYIFNVDLIHQGLYAGSGLFSALKGPRKSTSLTLPKDTHGDVLLLGMASVQQEPRKIPKSEIIAFEDGNEGGLADVSPEELEAIRRRCAEVGDKGEYFVFQFERKRLRNAGKPTLARKVDWVSRRSVGKGYDIKSFETNGSPRYIEVKSTTGSGMSFLMSDKEWKVAVSSGMAYFVYRVIHAEKSPTIKRMVQDPASAEKDRTLIRLAAGWKITLK